MAQCVSNRKILTVCLVLGLLFFFGGISGSVTKSLWADEFLGWCVMDRTPLLQMFLGVESQASPNPLYYIQERLLTFVAPYGSVNPLVLLRIGAAFDFAVLSALVFWFFFQENARSSLRWFVALGAAIFVYKSRFNQYYAIEARPYALWITLSFAHLFAIMMYVKESTKNHLRLLGISALGLTLVANVGIVQLGFGLLVLLWLRKITKPVLGVHIPSAIFAGFYIFNNPSYGYPAPTVIEFIRSVLSVFRETLGSPENNLVDGGLVLFLGLITFRLLKNSAPEKKALGLMTLTSALFCPVVFALILRKGYFCTPRQFCFLVPVLSLTFLYGLADVWSKLTQNFPFLYERTAKVLLCIAIVFWGIFEIPRFTQNYQHPYWKTYYKKDQWRMEMSMDDKIVKDWVESRHQELLLSN